MSFPTTIECAIVGAGPAGCAAARALAQGGVAAVILEKAALPRYKTCGGGVLRRAAQLLGDIPWQETIEHQACRVELNLLDSGLRCAAQRPAPLVSMTMRSAFDQALAQAAHAAGAQVFDRCAVRQVQDCGRHVDLTTDHGALRAQWVIGADGAGSLVAKAGRWPGHQRLLPALEWEVRVGPADWARFGQTARFDFDLPPHGYAWVFPKRDHLSIGVLDTQRGGNLNAICQAYMDRLGIREIRAVARHGYVIPVHPRSAGLARGRLLLTGDAAGLADPITAEGITHALQSGQLAAAAILQGRGEPARVRQNYQAALQRTILPELRGARRLAFLLYRHPTWRTWLLRRYGQRFTNVMADVIAGERRYTDLLHNPRNYLKLLRPTRHKDD